MSDRYTPVPDGDEDAAFDSTLSEQPLTAGQPTPAPEGEAAEDVKATGTRSASRSTRILLGALLLAVAAFIWFNYVWQPEQPQVVTGGNGTSARLGAGVSNGTASPATVPLVSGDGAAAGTTQVPAGPRPAVANGDDATPAAPSVAPLPTPGVVARDLEIVELPFLVTQPPVAEETGEEAVAEDEGASRPTAVRASVNPFSPVVLNTPEVTASSDFAPDAVEPGFAESPAPAAEQVIEVSIPDGPDQNAITTIQAPAGTTTQPGSSSPATAAGAPAPVAVPVPAAAAPVASAPAAQSSGNLAQSLPRPLPGPSLSPVPDVLQERRAIEDVPQPNLAQVAAVEEPGLDIGETVTERVADEDAGTPEVLPPVSGRVMPSDSDPLVAGITPLSRYLRDYDVTFTGMVLGPISQGVFHSNASPRPVVVGIGQQLPETEITLTDLRGQQAEFTLADASQFLTLDLRR